MTLYVPKFLQVSILPSSISSRSNKKLLTKGVCASNFQKAWAKGLTGKGIIVSVIDTGIGNNDNLKDKVIKTFNLTGEGVVENHGTHVAGTIAANGWLVGGAFNCKLLDIKVIDKNGGNINNIVKAIGISVTNGATVINMSLGGSGITNSEIQNLTGAIQNAWNHGCICIAAAGNDGTSIYTVDQYEYPASIEKVESVAACKVSENLQNITLAEFSNENNRVDLSACGVEVFSTINDNKYAVYSGTSMATPHVSAMAALLAEDIKNKYPTLTGSAFSANLVSLLHLNIMQMTQTTGAQSVTQSGKGYTSALSGATNIGYTSISYGLGFLKYDPKEPANIPLNSEKFYSEKSFVGFLVESP